MTTSETLSRLMLDRDEFMRNLEEMIHAVFSQMGHMAGVQNEELGAFVQKMAPFVERESAWLFEAEYENFVAVQTKALDEVYTEKELQFLLKLYEEQPWMTPKSRAVGQLIAKASFDIGQRVSQQVMKNLEETGELDKVFKSFEEGESEEGESPWKE